MRILPHGVGWSYAEKGGAPVLKEQTSWKKINGIWLNTPWGHSWALFRRDHRG